MSFRPIDWRVFLLEAVYLIVPIIGTILITMAISSSKLWLVLLGSFLFSGILATLPFIKAHIETQLDIAHESQITHLNKQITSLDDDLAMSRFQHLEEAHEKRFLEDSLNGVADLLRECIKKLKEINDLLSGAGRHDDAAKSEDLKNQMRLFSSVTVRHTLNKIRDIFDRPFDPLQDRRNARVTYFRLHEDVSSCKSLEYYDHAFPHAVSPTTTRFSEIEDAGSAAIKCLLSEDMVIVADVPAAAEIAETMINGKTSDSSPNWKTMYPGQPQKYGSMLCYPVVIGRHRDEDNRRFVGVVTITVGPHHRNYFRVGPKHVQANGVNDYVTEDFITDILHPFSLVLAILAESERSDSILWTNSQNPGANAG